MTPEQRATVEMARLELIDAGRRSDFLDWILNCPPDPAEAEHVGTVYTMEALVPGGEVKHYATLHQPLAAGTKLYAEVLGNDPTTKASYARMFGMACDDLCAIADSFGINSDLDGGAEPILAAIEDLRLLAGHADMHVFQMADGELWIGPSHYACVVEQMREHDIEHDLAELQRDNPPVPAEVLGDRLTYERAQGGTFPRLFSEA